MPQTNQDLAVKTAEEAIGNPEAYELEERRALLGLPQQIHARHKISLDRHNTK